MHIRNYANQLLNQRNWRASRSQPAYARFCCSLRRNQRSHLSLSPPVHPIKRSPEDFSVGSHDDGSSRDARRYARRGETTREPGEPETMLKPPILLSVSFLRRSVGFEYDADAWDVKSSKRAPGTSCGQRFLRSSVIEDG